MEIIIRALEPDDAEEMTQVWNQPRVLAGTLQLPYTSIARRRERMTDVPPGHYPLAAVVDGKLVGSLHFHTFPNSPRRRHAGSFGMAVHDDWQGKGVGSALVAAALEMADGWLNLERVELQVFTDNEPAVNLYKKFGFEIEGTHRRYAFRDGQYAHVYTMARFRDDVRPAAEEAP